MFEVNVAAPNDHGGDILELTREGVVGSVAAGAAATPVHYVDRGMWLEEGQQRAPARVIGGRAVDQ
jgi:hypothetical protein